MESVIRGIVGTFLKIIISSAVAGIGSATVFIALNRVFETILNVRWVNLAYGCLKMMFAPILLLPFGDLVTIENGVPKSSPPSYVALILANGLIYLILGGLFGAGYLWARWLMYGVIFLVSAYWLFCIGTTMLF